MSAYTILLIIALPLGVASFVCGIWVDKKWVKNTAIPVLVACILALVVCVFAFFGILINKDFVVQKCAWRQMVENGEIDVYDDVGHLTSEAINYNIEIAVIQDSISKRGRWSTYYGTGAEELMPITREGAE